MEQPKTSEPKVETQAKEAPASNGIDFAKFFKDSLEIVKGVFVKPATEGAKKLEGCKDVKFAAFFTAFVLIATTLVSLITTILSSVVVKSYNFSLSSGMSSKTKIDWSNLNNVDYLKVIGNNILYTAIVIAVIVIVAYIVALVMKKTVNFAKLLGVVAAGMIPLCVASLIGTIFGLFWSEGAMLFSAVGTIWAGVNMISGIDKEVAAEGDERSYYHILTISVICVLLYLIFTNMLKSAVSSSLLNGLGM